MPEAASPRKEATVTVAAAVAAPGPESDVKVVDSALAPGELNNVNDPAKSKKGATKLTEEQKKRQADEREAKKTAKDVVKTEDDAVKAELLEKIGYYYLNLF